MAFQLYACKLSEAMFFCFYILIKLVFELLDFHDVIFVYGVIEVSWHVFSEIVEFLLAIAVFRSVSFVFLGSVRKNQ